MKKDEEILARINDLTKYIDKLTIKTMYLDDDADRTDSIIENQGNDIRVLSGGSKMKLQQLKEDIYSLSNDVRKNSARIESLIGEFRRMVKREDYDRLKASVRSMRFEYIEQF